MKKVCSPGSLFFVGYFAGSLIFLIIFDNLKLKTAAKLRSCLRT